MIGIWAHNDCDSLFMRRRAGLDVNTQNRQFHCFVGCIFKWVTDRSINILYKHTQCVESGNRKLSVCLCESDARIPRALPICAALQPDADGERVNFKCFTVQVPMSCFWYKNVLCPLPAGSCGSGGFLRRKARGLIDDCSICKMISSFIKFRRARESFAK